MTSNNNITNPKCSNCKCYFTPEIKSSGQPFKTCDKCRTKDKESRNCEHGKRKIQCKECGGSSFCMHDKRKTQCKECSGSSFCIHEKRKSICKECGGSSFCIHEKRKSICKECGGSSVCIHDKRKTQCKECGGSSFCLHEKRKTQCKECNFKLYLVGLQRSQITRCFKISKSSKNKHSIEYLGCNVEELINYFQKKIDYFNAYLSTSEEMTFFNIHIDHIKPVSKFNLVDEDEFLDCCHYSNLQPLLSNTNLEKSNKWNEENNKYWLDNIKGQEYNEIYIP